MYSVRNEVVSPDSFDAHFGQITKVTEVIYRCSYCNLPSEDFMKVNGYSWNRFPERKFCGSRCADKWAAKCYEDGTYVSWAGEERIDYDLDEKVKYVYQYQELNDTEYLDVAFWLRNLFIQYDASFKSAGKEWAIEGGNRLEYVNFIQLLQNGVAFNLGHKPDLLDFINNLSSLFHWNNISLRWELAQEYRTKEIAEVVLTHLQEIL